MNLNQIRLLEACHSYLVERTHSSIKEQLVSDKLVFSCNNNFCTFNTYQEMSYNYTFIDYELNSFELREKRREIQDISELYDALKLSGNELSVLSQITNVDTARIQIFKLLSRVDIEPLATLYPKLKTDNYIYDVYNLTIDKSFPVYHLSNTASFDLVSIA